MGFTDTGFVRLMKSKMAYLGQRQSVLAQNVANADTPNYKARDLAPFSFTDALREAHGGPGMKVTNVSHIVPASMAGVNAASKKMNSFETVPSGNAVELEQQMMEVSKTALDYQTITAVFHKFMGLYRTAIGK